MRRTPRAAALWAAAALVIAAAFLYAVSALRRDIVVTEGVEPRPLPQFALTTYEGEEVTQKEFFGKPALIFVWASWCSFCVEGLADLTEIKREFGDAVAVVAINRAESPETARRFSASAGMATGIIFLLDPDDVYYRAIGGFAMPEMIFAPRAGMIRFHKRGPMEREELRRRIWDLME